MTFTTVIKVVKLINSPFPLANVIRPLGKWLLGRLRKRWKVKEIMLRSCK
jgi:hypothetical protein